MQTRQTQSDLAKTNALFSILPAKRGWLILVCLFCILGQSRAELKPLTLLPQCDYYIKGHYRFEQKNVSLDFGDFEVLYKNGRFVYSKVLSNDTLTTTLPAQKSGWNIRWPAKLCREQLRMDDRILYLSNDSGGVIVVNPSSSNELLNDLGNACPPLSTLRHFMKYLQDLSRCKIQKESDNTYFLSWNESGFHMSMRVTVGANGLITHAETFRNDEKRGSIEIEYLPNSDFPKRCFASGSGNARLCEFDEVLTGTAASERPTSLTLLQNGLDVADRRFNDDPQPHYIITGGDFLSDREVSMKVAQIKQERAARKAALLEAQKRHNTMLNDPHNMKDVPVTGESWGNKLRRVPNWAYGGAVVLFLGGWFVAASRRRKK